MKYKFRTNINCGGCVASVTPHLNENPDILDWNVDTNNSNKILTVETDSLTEDEVMEVVEKAGYQAEPLSA